MTATANKYWPPRMFTDIYNKALEYYRLPVGYTRTFSLGDKIDPTTGNPYLNAMPVEVATKKGRASWAQVNLSETGVAMGKYGPVKPKIEDISVYQNLTLDFEFPPNPQKLRLVATSLRDYLIQNGLAADTLPIEDSGAGNHIALPLVPIITAECGGPKLVNEAAAYVVRHYIEPEFKRLLEEYGLAGPRPEWLGKDGKPREIKLEAFNIDRIFSLPGTWRPGGTKSNEVAYLAIGFTRSWLYPYIGSGIYPSRVESESLTDLIKAACITLEAESGTKERAASVPVTPGQKLNGKHDITPAEWLNDYSTRSRKTGDRSSDFHGLVTAFFLKFGPEDVEYYAELMDELTGGKYGKRAGAEALRSLKKAKTLPRISREEWYASRAYTLPAEPVATIELTKETIEPMHTPPSGPPALPASTTQQPFKTHHLTDMGNARRLVERFGEFLRYVEEWGWLVWDGRRWKIDRTGAAERYAKRTVATIYSEAGQEEDTEKRKEISDWARKSESKAKLDALLELAQSEIEVRATPEEFDREPLLLNCENGTLDLRTGQLYKHRRDDKFTKLVPVAYDPSATAPTWLKFLDRIMAGNQNLITYLQRATGYTLTGLVTEHCLFFLYGSGKNGKSTFTQTLLEMLGDYQIKSPTSMVMIKRNEGIPNDLARLAGVRLTVTAEVEDGQRLAESLIKDLTGGDIVTARYLRKEYFDFQPTHKLWMFGNHKPQIRGTDEGIWRRIKLIPFNQFITPEERDPDLGQKLKAELPGILAWAVQGCQEWRREGMTEPAEVVAATQTYRAEMDALATFIGDCCITGVNNKVKASDLYQEYQKWCTTNNEFTLSARKFSARMTERGFHSDRGTGGHYQWKGISLLLDESEFLESMGVSDE